MNDFELEKIKYHHQLLLIIATSLNKEETRFFQNIVSFNLSEEDSKALLTLVQLEDVETLTQFMDTLDSGYEIEYLLRDLIAQDLLTAVAKKMLNEI